MKNNIIKIGLFGILAMGAASCQDTLDTHPTTTFDEATVWGSKATANAFVNATYDNVIIVRHGGYLTVYAGLTNISVSKGQKVKAGQTLGTIWTNPDAGNRTELHFEVRHERTKLNPLEWVR